MVKYGCDWLRAEVQKKITKKRKLRMIPTILNYAISAGLRIDHYARLNVGLGVIKS